MEDMLQYPHLRRHPKTGKLLYRRRIPADVRHAFHNRHEIKKSFGTCALKEALPDYHELAATTERKINAARAGTQEQANAAEFFLT